MFNDQDIWEAAAEKLDESISALNQGTQFNRFHPIKLHTLYMVASLCYYKLHTAFMSDVLFDKLCGYILDNYEEFKSIVRHPETTLCKDRLRAGTGYDLEYPPAIWCISEALISLRCANRKELRNITNPVHAKHLVDVVDKPKPLEKNPYAFF